MKIREWVLCAGIISGLLWIPSVLWAAGPVVEIKATDGTFARNGKVSQPIQPVQKDFFGHGRDGMVLAPTNDSLKVGDELRLVCKPANHSEEKMAGKPVPEGDYTVAVALAYDAIVRNGAGQSIAYVFHGKDASDAKHVGCAGPSPRCCCLTQRSEDPYGRRRFCTRKP